MTGREADGMTSDPYAVDVVTEIPLQRLRAGTGELLDAGLTGYLGASADRLSWGLTRDWHYGPALRAKWSLDTRAAMALDARLSHMSYRSDSAEELAALIDEWRSRGPQYAWWYFDAGTTCNGLRTHRDSLVPALRELGVLP